MSTAAGAAWDSTFQYSSITPSDTAKLSYTNSAGVVEPNKRCRALYVGGAGDVSVHDDAGNAVVFTGVTAGSVYPISTDTVMSTNTTATSLVALF